MIVESGRMTRSTEEWLISRSCHRATFSRAASALVRTRRARPQMRSASSGLRLCGMALEPFCPSPKGSWASRISEAQEPFGEGQKGLLGFEDLRALQPTHFEGDFLERGRGDRQHRAELGMAVTLYDLRGDRRRFQTELTAHLGFEVRLDVGKVADGTRGLGDPDRRPGSTEPVEAPPRSGVPDRHFESKAGGFCMDAVCPADGERVLVTERQNRER